MDDPPIRPIQGLCNTPWTGQSGYSHWTFTRPQARQILLKLDAWLDILIKLHCSKKFHPFVTERADNGPQYYISLIVAYCTGTYLPGELMGVPIVVGVKEMDFLNPINGRLPLDHKAIQIPNKYGIEVLCLNNSRTLKWLKL